MKQKALRIYRFLKTMFTEFSDSDPFTYSAAIAFYTLFSLPAIIFLLIQGAGWFYGDQAISGELHDQINDIVGMEAALLVEELMAQVEAEPKGFWTTLLSTAAVLIGSTTVFVSIQNGLNHIWSVKPKPSAGFIKMLLDRLFSFTLVISLGFLMVVSLTLETLLAAFTRYIEQSFPEMTVWLAKGINWTLSVCIMVALFSILFKVLPDVKITWKQSWIGGLATTLLFILGKYLISIYLETSDLDTSYGAAGSLVLLLVWVYYSSTIVLLGGKITEVYVKQTVGNIKPSAHAMVYTTKEVILKKGH